MGHGSKLFREGKTHEIWSRYCGFLDLSLTEFDQIQHELLREQLALLSECELGQHILGPNPPRNTEEFRRMVPLTSYESIRSYVEPHNEAALPRQPKLWAHTTGRYGSYKEVPYTSRMHRQMGRYVLASLILASCNGRGDVHVQENDTLLYLAAPPPFSSGVSARALDEEIDLRFLPPLAEAEQMEYTERVAVGFRLAVQQGIDMFYGVTSVLVGIGRRFARHQDHGLPSEEKLNPAAAARMAAAKMKARMAGRSLLPRDLWRVKGIMSGGTDTEIFRDEVARLWGVSPLEAYGGTEMGLVAMQSWDRAGLVFVPDVDFLEFIPEEESLRTREGAGTFPSTLLLPELGPGKNYELVITSFHGGAYVRYRTRDLFHVLRVSNPESGVKLPHFAFHSRLDDVIDLAGFTRLTERTLWKAIHTSGVGYNDWTVRKEMHGHEPVLHLYLEVSDSEPTPDPVMVRSRVDEALKQLDVDYRNLDEMIELHPLRVTLLRPGTFQRYTAARVAEGADLGHYKPARINPSEQILEQLLKLSDTLSSEGPTP